MSSSSKTSRAIDHQRQHHREAAEDGAGDEVGREDRGVPAGQLRRGEVEATRPSAPRAPAAWRGRRGQVGRLVVLPVAVRAAPAEREDAVERSARRLALARSRSVARSGIRPDVPEEQRDREVGRDREDVPHQRAAEVRPDAHLVRDGQHPVVQPDAADVDAGEDQRADDGEERHRLGGAVDRGAPLLPEQEEDRRDQRAGVADTDPEDEVGDVPGPADRDLVAPDADALPEQPGHRDAEQRQQAARCRGRATSRAAASTPAGGRPPR